MLTRPGSWLGAVLRRDAFEDEMDEEMRAHLERRAAELIRQGVAPAEAARRARLAFGSIEKQKDLVRESVGLRLIDDLRGDIRVALRRLASKPAYALFIMATIGLGIGAATAVFSVVDQSVLRPPPFVFANRLVDVLDPLGNNLTPAKILGWQSQPALFERLEAYAPQQFDLSRDGEPERVIGWQVSTGLFDMLGVGPQIGRNFRADDGRPGTERVAIISDALWRRRFGAAPDALGRGLALNDHEYTIVGVMPSRFRLHSEQDDVWVPFDLRAHLGDVQADNFYAIGRLARGVPMNKAQALSDLLAARLQREAPLKERWNLDIEPKHIAHVEPATRTAMLVLLGAVGFVLLITCVNVTSMCLTDVPARLREMAVRSALGGSRLRLMRSMLIETTILAAAGGALGVGLADWAVKGIVAAIPTGMLWWRTTTIEVDARVVVVAFAMIVATALGVGIVPALRGSNARPDSLLKGGAGRTATGRLPGALVVAQVAFSLILLAGAALMTRTLVNLESIDPGFNPKGLVAVNIGLASDRYPTRAARAAFLGDIRQKIGRIPGVTATALGPVPPASGGFTVGRLQVDGVGAARTSIAIALDWISPDYFAATQTPLVAGRTFSVTDPDDSVIVSEPLARVIAPAGGAIGRRFTIPAIPHGARIVGVVKAVEARVSDTRMPFQIYQPLPHATASAKPGRAPQGPRTYTPQTLIIRARNPTAVIPEIERQVWSADPDQPIDKIALATDMYADAFARQRFVLMLMSAFSVIALVLTAAGIFGLLARMVAQGTREIGIRMALGADRTRVLRMIAIRGMMLTLAGAATGLASARVLTPVLESQLFEVTPTDPISYAFVVALLAIVALAACWLPARAAMRVDPAVALRVE